MKSEFNFKIVYADGREIDMYEDKNYWVSSCRVQPISFSRTLEKVDGRRGLIETSTMIESRKINATFQIDGYDATDFDMTRDAIYALFNPADEFYIVRDLQPGKRYKVKVSNLTGVEYEDGSLEDGGFEVEFEMFQPFAESIGTSLQLQNAKEWDVGLWQWAQGIDGDTTYQYEFNTNNFIVKNFGNVLIDPRENELEITIKAIASSYLEIKNITTGDIYRFNGSLTSGDTLILKGIQTFKNGVSAFGKTNTKLLSLTVGDNIFAVSGGTLISAAFNFRPLYY